MIVSLHLAQESLVYYVLCEIFRALEASRPIVLLCYASEVDEYRNGGWFHA